MIEMAQQLAAYLQSAGEGVLGSSLFVDNMPQSPDEIFVIKHAGGSAELKFDAPDAWSKLTMESRSVTSTGAHQRIWGAVQKLVSPDNGVIAVANRTYTVQITALPSLQEVDSAGRFLMKCALIVRQVDEVNDPWLDAISDFTVTVLSAEWRIYKGFNGTCRPSISWQCKNHQLDTGAMPAHQLVKTFVGQIAASTSNQYQQAAQAMVQGLTAPKKLPLPGAAGRWLTAAGPRADIRTGDLSTGLIELTLTGPILQIFEDVPLIAGVHAERQIKD